MQESSFDEPSPCLSAVELFQRIPEGELDELNRMLPLKIFRSGELVYDPLREVSVLFIVKTGRVRIFQTSSSGKTFTLAVYEAGDVFGNMPILGQDMGASYAEALEKSTLCQLSQPQVEQFFLADSRISQQVAIILARRVSDLERRISDLALRPLAQRIASLLLSFAKPSPLPWKEEYVKLTHEQLANLAGATREAVSKVLSDLAHKGMIKQNRGSISIRARRDLEIFKETVGD